MIGAVTVTVAQLVLMWYEKIGLGDIEGDLETLKDDPKQWKIKQAHYWTICPSLKLLQNLLCFSN